MNLPRMAHDDSINNGSVTGYRNKHHDSHGYIR